MAMQRIKTRLLLQLEVKKKKKDRILVVLGKLILRIWVQVEAKAGTHILAMQKPVTFRYQLAVQCEHLAY